MLMNKRSTCLGVLPIRGTLCLSSSIINIAVYFLSCQLRSCNLFTQHSYLPSFGRETSLVNIMGQRSIFPPLFTPPLLSALLFCCNHYYFPLLCLILCKQQDRRD